MKPYQLSPARILSTPFLHTHVSGHGITTECVARTGAVCPACDRGHARTSSFYVAYAVQDFFNRLGKVQFRDYAVLEPAVGHPTDFWLPDYYCLIVLPATGPQPPAIMGWRRLEHMEIPPLHDADDSRFQAKVRDMIRHDLKTMAEFMAVEFPHPWKPTFRRLDTGWLR